MKSSKIIILTGLLIAISIFSFQFAFSVKNVIESPSWFYEAPNEFICVDISTDGQYIVAGTEDFKVYLFHYSSSTPIWTFESDDLISHIAISSDGNYIVAARYSREFYVFNRSDPTPLWEFDVGSNLIIQSLAISSEGQYLAVVYDKLYFFNISSYLLWNTNFTARNVALSSNGHYIALSGQDDKQYLLNYTSPTPMWSYETGSIITVSISANGDYIVAGQTTALPSTYGRVYVFNRYSSTPMWFYDYSCEVSAVDISADGNYIVTGGYNGNICLFKTTDSTPIWNYRTEGEIRSSSINYDGAYLICENYNSHVYVFHRSNSIPIWTFEDYYSYIGDVFKHTTAISSSGRYLSFTSYDVYFIDITNPLIITNLIEYITTNLMILGYEFLISIWLYQFITKYIVYKKQKRDKLKADLKARRNNSLIFFILLL